MQHIPYPNKLFMHDMRRQDELEKKYQQLELEKKLKQEINDLRRFFIVLAMLLLIAKLLMR